MTSRIARLAGAAFLWLAASAVAAPQLLSPVTPAGPAARAKSGEAGAPVRFNAETVGRMAPGDEVELTLPDGTRHTYLFERSVDHGGGLVSWIAQSPLSGDNERAIITYGPQGAWGWMKTRYGEYRVAPTGLGYELLKRSEDIGKSAGRLPGGDAIPAPPDAPHVGAVKGVPTALPTIQFLNALGQPKLAPTPSVRADVMFIYTKDLAQKVGVGLMPMLYNLMTTVNQAAIDSEVAITYRLVNATMLDYPNANGSSATLSAMAGSGAFASIFQTLTWGAGSVRETVGADFVALLRDGPTDTGGIGFLPKNPTIYPGVHSPLSSNAYSVNNYCAGDCGGILAHEMGHNSGNHHDRGTVAEDANGATPLAEGVFPYSYGHYSCLNGLSCNPFVPGGCPGYPDCASRVSNDFGTIMSYLGPSVKKFSNPLLLTCVPAGGDAGAPRICGGATVAPAPAGNSDNALSMNNVRASVSAYRNETLASLPGSLQFTNTAFAGTETGGTLAVTVGRTGGSSGSVTVNYTVTGGTATSGVDFTVANGTLTWPNGDATNKTINITLTNDMAVEGIENLKATLSTPTGAPGVYLGYPTEAAGLIVEAWPPGTLGGLPNAPAGWSTPAGSSVAWAISNDSAPVGDPDGLSLKSGLLNFATKNCNSDGTPGGTAAPCPSMVQFAGTFLAGPVTFAYRMNGLPYGYGLFEFFVDGTRIIQISAPTDDADTGWQTFSTDLTAGAHTLTWQYRSALGFDCDGPFFSGPPQVGPFPGCQDRAWIDQVSLPVVRAATTTTLASSANPSNSGQSVTFTATVTGSSGTPTGTVQFRNGAATIAGCSAATMTAGSATCATTALPPGANSITAVYSGSTTYNTSTSSPLAQTVNSGPQLFTANPPTLAFGGQSMNTTSPALTSTLTNTTGAPITISSIVASTGYAVSHNCGAAIPAAGTCVVTATFTPPAAPSTGALNGTVTVSYPGGGPTIVALTGTAEKSLVTHYYRSILRRAPDSGGKTFWEAEAPRVAALGANVNEAWFAMAQAFYFSAEYAAFNRNNTAFITDLYNTFFNRAPDGPGLAFWVGQLDSGLPREVALSAYMFSAEFSLFTQAIFGSPVVRAELNTITDFYRGLLARLPDDGGFNFWVARFRTAQCTGAAAVVSEVEAISSLFATSAEYTGRGRSNAQYIGDLYNAFLRRGGDLGGVQFWIGQLATRTREDIRVEFKNSAEFQGRVTAILGAGCI